MIVDEVRGHSQYPTAVAAGRHQGARRAADQGARGEERSLANSWSVRETVRDVSMSKARNHPMEKIMKQSAGMASITYPLVLGALGLALAACEEKSSAGNTVSAPVAVAPQAVQPA